MCIGLFLIGWGILHDASEETPWLTAGIGSCILMIGAVMMREIVLRNSRARFVTRETTIKRQMNGVHGRLDHVKDTDKLTVERNYELVREIVRKSDAAEVLGSFGAVHRDIFKLCEAYLAKNDLELRNIGAGSPRLGSLRKGRDAVFRYHRYHLLRWAEIETGNLNRIAVERSKSVDKVEAAHEAMGVLDYALGFYPDDRSLLDSRAALSEMVISVEVSRLVEDAEREVFQGNLKQARRNYREALYVLGKDSVFNASRELAAGRIIVEIEKLDRFESVDKTSSAFADNI